MDRTVKALKIETYTSLADDPQTSKQGRVSCLYPFLLKLLRGVVGKLQTRLTRKRNGKRCQRHQEKLPGYCYIWTVYTFFDVVKESCRQYHKRKSLCFPWTNLPKWWVC